MGSARRMGTLRCEAAWKRVVQRVMIILATARQQMVVDSMVMSADTEKLQPSSSSSFKGEAKAKKPKDAHIDQGIGKPLSRSKAHKTFAKEPQDCNHPPDKLRCRANAQFQWWTCTLCGNRWERTSEEVKTPADLPPTSEDAAKLRNNRGQEFPQFLPAPRGRLSQGDKFVEMDRSGKPRALGKMEERPNHETGSALSSTTRATTKDPNKVRNRPSGIRPTQRSKTPTRTTHPEVHEIGDSDDGWDDTLMKEESGSE